MTPVKALFFAVLVNVALKILLMGPYAQVGLAFATSIGAWVNLALLLWLASRADLVTFDERLRRSAAKLALAGVVLAAALWLAYAPITKMFAGSALRDELSLLTLGLWSALVYGISVVALFGRQWLMLFRGRPRGGSAAPDHD
jgi:putative peptidoglycan lipid II flippase